MINFLKRIFAPLPKEHHGPYKPNNVPPMQEGQYIATPTLKKYCKEESINGKRCS